MREHMIYLDNAATTKMYEEAVQSYTVVQHDFFGNPSSLHQVGVQAHQLLEKARRQVAQLLGVQPEEIFFTSGGTEGDNWAVKGTAFEKQVFGKHIIVSQIEHPAVLQSVKQMEQLGFEVDYAPVTSEGIVDVEALSSLIRKDTILVSIMAVNNEVGTIQPLQDIARCLEAYPSIHFHVDAVQAVPYLQSIMKCERIDLLTLSAHKFHGPRGVGIFYKRAGRKLQPLLSGGGQERQERSTTENVAGIVATAKALRMTLEKEEKSNVLELSNTLRTYLKQKKGFRIFSPEGHSPYIVCFALEGVRGEVMVHALEDKGIFVSTTSACSSKKSTDSSTLTAMNVPSKWATGAIRVSFSHDNTLEEVHTLIHALEELSQQFSLFRK